MNRILIAGCRTPAFRLRNAGRIPRQFRHIPFRRYGVICRNRPSRLDPIPPTRIEFNWAIRRGTKHHGNQRKGIDRMWPPPPDAGGAHLSREMSVFSGPMIGTAHSPSPVPHVVLPARGTIRIMDRSNGAGLPESDPDPERISICPDRLGSPKQRLSDEVDDSNEITLLRG